MKTWCIDRVSLLETITMINLMILKKLISCPEQVLLALVTLLKSNYYKRNLQKEKWAKTKLASLMILKNWKII
jgi:hypothetical protein